MTTTGPTPRPERSTPPPRRTSARQRAPAQPGDYTPRVPGTLECPACGAVFAMLPPELEHTTVALADLQCAACRQVWCELAPRNRATHSRYWDPA
jgi:hypothetical protein